MHQDVSLYAGRLDQAQRVTHPLRAGRHAWIQVAHGDVELDGLSMRAGDGAAIEGVAALDIVAISPSEILLFDLV